MPKPSFDDVYRCLEEHGPAHIRSSRDTDYEVHPEVVNDKPAIVGRLAGDAGKIVVHEDCWGDDTTCQGTWAGGLYNGNTSIWDWYERHCGHKTKP